jgi:hypothetical protein
MKSSHSKRIGISASLMTRVLDRGACWRILAVLGLAFGVAGLTGCTPLRGLREYVEYNDACNDFVMGWRNSAWARQAWHERKHMYVGEPQFVAFGQGFRDGYADVASGSSGCVPPLPPRRYWTWQYQTGEGQAKVAAWFAGYPHGAKAAQEDGAGNFQQIQVSHLIEAEYSADFRAGKCPDCDPSQILGGEAIELLPPEGNSKMAPLPTPIPAPMTDQTSQLMPIGEWSHGPITRIPRINNSNSGFRVAEQYGHEIDPAVVPASAQFPIPDSMTFERN